MKKKRVAVFCLYFILMGYSVAEGLATTNLKHTQERKHSKIISKDHIEHSIQTKCHMLKPFHEVIKKTLITKKAEIEGAIKTIETSDHKDKRGFLANLANLLNDAEAISGHKKESGLSSFTLSDTQPAESTAKVSDDTTKNVGSAKKEEIIPSSEEIQTALKTSASKDFAPIFAMFHGKIIPLGKLPENAFKKSRTELPSDTPISIEKHSQPMPTPEHAADEKEVADKTSTTQKKDEPTQQTTEVQTSEATNKNNDKKLKSEVAKLSKLQSYLSNLDSHSPATGTSKTVRGTAKDIVSFPEEGTGSPKSEILSHVKGVVLDNGKILSVNSNKLENSDESAKNTDDSQQKFIVTDDGSLTPVNKAKPEIGDAVARDQTGGSEGQKTVALSLDVLKDLLKKSDNKISLASLLNKNGDAKSDTPAEDEDPGTIEDFAAGGLKSHNEYRSKHHDDSLIWSDDLAAKAQKLAEALADKKTLEIAKDLEKEGYGENVAKVWATFKNAGEAATKMWYSQSENYHFDDPHLDENTGQFAQLIWHGTKELGMGVAKSIDDVNNKYVYVTALYKPPGNIEATLRQNVLPTGNSTVDVYTTFFKRAGVSLNKRSKLANRPVRKLRKAEKVLNIIDEID